MAAIFTPSVTKTHIREFWHKFVIEVRLSEFNEFFLHPSQLPFEGQCATELENCVFLFVPILNAVCEGVQIILDFLHKSGIGV